MTKKMNHKSRSGTTITSSKTTDNSVYEGEDTLIGLVIQVSYENEGCTLFAEASLGGIGLQFPYARIGRELAPTLCIQTHISHALAPTSCLFLQQAKMPHLGYIGVPPPPRGSCNMSEDGDGGSDREPALAAAEEYIMGGTGNPLIDVGEDQDEELPVLSSIWECPMINKFAGFDNNGKPFSGWTCGWCPLENDDGSQPNPFWSMNATKALIHVAKVSGYEISRPVKAVFQQQRVGSTETFISPRL
jgi:hypothetical protein